MTRVCDCCPRISNQPISNPLENIDKKIEENIKQEKTKEEPKEEEEWEKTELDDTDFQREESKDDFEDETINPINKSSMSQSIRDERPVATNTNLGSYGRSYMSFMLGSDHDHSYGPHMEDETLKMGNYPMILKPNDDIKIGDRTYEGTAGLYSLIFEKEPRHFTQADAKNYKDLLELTQRHLKSDGSIKSNSGYKYKNEWSHLYKKKGRGVMSLNNKPIEYIYYDDLNELVDRLEILIREQNSGHTGHNNEIQSILEELREAGVIKNR